MAFWWVNHKQTVRQETEGGYVWSPKANANGARNASYDNLTRCQPGDVVYSYAYGRIGSIGLVETAAITAPKPPEFGSAGDYWSQEGWLVRVNWQPLREPLVPQTFFALLQPCFRSAIARLAPPVAVETKVYIWRPSTRLWDCSCSS